MAYHSWCRLDDPYYAFRVVYTGREPGSVEERALRGASDSSTSGTFDCEGEMSLESDSDRFSIESDCDNVESEDKGENVPIVQRLLRFITCAMSFSSVLRLKKLTQLRPFAGTHLGTEAECDLPVSHVCCNSLLFFIAIRTAMSAPRR